MLPVRVWTFIGLATAITACGGGSTTPTNPSTPPSAPPPTTFTLSGRVTETPPTQSVGIAGALITVADGPNAGRSITTDSNGNYTLGNLQQSGFTVTASAEGYESRSQGVDLTGNRTLNFNLSPSGPRRTFGPGQHLVGSDIAPGRYFADPPRDACYWERQSGLGGSLDDVIANDFVGFDPAQIIVDILASDRAFEADGDCGIWLDTPRHGAQTNINAGTWLVGDQIAPGIYRTNASSGCYWERLRDFRGEIRSILANDFVGDAGSQLVEIRSSDVGFNTDDECGQWTRVSGITESIESGAKSSAEVEANRARQREQSGMLSGRR